MTAAEKKELASIIYKNFGSFREFCRAADLDYRSFCIMMGQGYRRLTLKTKQKWFAALEKLGIKLDEVLK
jgi:hypothetical protein